MIQEGHSRLDRRRHGHPFQVVQHAIQVRKDEVIQVLFKLRTTNLPQVECKIAIEAQRRTLAKSPLRNQLRLSSNGRVHAAASQGPPSGGSRGRTMVERLECLDDAQLSQ